MEFLMTSKYRKNLERPQGGFTLLETLLSLSILMIVVGAYLSTRSKTFVSLASTEVSQNLIALRHFVRTNFSCEETMEKNNAFKREDGFIEVQSCPKFNTSTGSILAYNLDGKPLLGHQTNVRVGPYRIWSTCSEEPTTKPSVKVAHFRFLAQALDKDGKPLRDFFDKKKQMRTLDIFDGMTIPCQMPNEALPPRPGQGCSIAMRTGGKLTSSITGKALRNKSPSVVFEFRTAYDGSDTGSFGKPSRWKFYFVNKSPKDSYSNATSILTSPFFLNSNAQVYPSVSPLSRMPECVAVAGDPAQESLAEMNPNCKYWGETFPLSSFQTPTQWFDAHMDLIADALDSSGTKISSCAITLKITDPLILSWYPVDRPMPDFNQTISKFDYNGTGRPRQVNWIYGDDVAYLVLDANNNNFVDSGAELFSEVMVLGDGKRAQHGFEALAHFDSDQNGIIDKNDPVFDKLKLWFDLNGNSVSEAEELVSTHSVELEQIQLKYRKLDPRDIKATPGTRFAYEGVFYAGGRCQKSGCRTLEVFFGYEPDQLNTDGSGDAR